MSQLYIQDPQGNRYESNHAHIESHQRMMYQGNIKGWNYGTAEQLDASTPVNVSIINTKLNAELTQLEKENSIKDKEIAELKKQLAKNEPTEKATSVGDLNAIEAIQYVKKMTDLSKLDLLLVTEKRKQVIVAVEARINSLTENA
jgi:hypothetical protein